LALTNDDAPVRTLVIGASYGLLPAAKIACAGHPVTVVGRPKEIAEIGTTGIEIDLGHGTVLRPRIGAGSITLVAAEQVDPDAFDLALVAIQEPHATAPEISALFGRIGGQLPVASVMNMPPPTFLERISSLPTGFGQDAYAALESWSQLPSNRMSMASPDPQVFRPVPDYPGRLQVTLASNFKFAPFEDPADQALLSRIARSASRVRADGRPAAVKLLAKGSVFVPFSKWPMLVAGNCRCLKSNGSIVSIREAVHADVTKSRSIYDAVNSALCFLGAPVQSLVPFLAYAKATEELVHPSSLARALAAGATLVERVDLLVLQLLRDIAGNSIPSEAIEAMEYISAAIDSQIALNK
jgi:hypothetical protein